MAYRFLFFVNGGTKLQELPEIKNCALESAPNRPKGKERCFIAEMLWSKSPKKVSARREAPLCVLAPLRESSFFSQSRKDLPAEGRRKKASEVKPLRLGALPAVDMLCVSTFFTHKGEKQSCQLKPLRLCAFARVIFYSRKVGKTCLRKTCFA
jgi:hypothetical protein